MSTAHHLRSYYNGERINKKPILFTTYPRKSSSQHPLVTGRWQRKKLQELIQRIEGRKQE